MFELKNLKRNLKADGLPMTLVTFSQVSSSDKTAIEEWISPQ